MNELNTCKDVSMPDLVAFKTATEFSMYIEEVALKEKMTYLETIMIYCDEHMIDPSDIAGKITKSLKSKLEIDYIKLNYLPKTAQLDM